MSRISGAATELQQLTVYSGAAMLLLFPVLLNGSGHNAFRCFNCVYRLAYKNLDQAFDLRRDDAPGLK
ncbi:MAG: hypothetical protein B0W54_18045 [Cellvibrio sp. 79]|nr:MAG: hypothetical protein B0W54_18045 [Cellvibrio sp. 79]